MSETGKPVGEALTHTSRKFLSLRPHLDEGVLFLRNAGQLQGFQTPNPEIPRKNYKINPGPRPRTPQKKLKKLLTIPVRKYFVFFGIF